MHIFVKFHVSRGSDHMVILRHGDKNSVTVKVHRGQHAAGGKKYEVQGVSESRKTSR